MKTVTVTEEMAGGEGAAGDAGVVVKGVDVVEGASIRLQTETRETMNQMICPPPSPQPLSQPLPRYPL